MTKKYGFGIKIQFIYIIPVFVPKNYQTVRSRSRLLKNDQKLILIFERNFLILMK